MAILDAFQQLISAFFHIKFIQAVGVFFKFSQYCILNILKNKIKLPLPSKNLD